jgi:hypothetical protein
MASLPTTASAAYAAAVLLALTRVLETLDANSEATPMIHKRPAALA